jgi:hypothetical protein
LPKATVPATATLQQAKLAFGASLSVVKPSTSTPVSTSTLLPPSTPQSGSSAPTDAIVPKQCKVNARIHLKLRIIAGVGAVAADFSIRQEEAAPLEGIKKKRRVYTGKEKAAAVAAVEALPGTSTNKAMVLRRTDGYEKVLGEQLAKWSNPTVPKKRGPKVNLDFQRDVLDQLIYTQVAHLDEPTSVAVVANVAYSYEVIRHAAQAVKKLPEYAGDAKVQSMKFSNPWIKDFIDHNSLHRRAVTAVDKVLPSVEEVRGTMDDIAKTKIDGEFLDDVPVS